MRGLNVRIFLLGPLIEGGDFWDGFDVERGRTDWLECADLVVLPAFVEHRPRRLLLALAAGIPVIASPACGISGLPGVDTVDAGDCIVLRETVLSVLKADTCPAIV
jgi:hypothetical protein